VVGIGDSTGEVAHGRRQVAARGSGATLSVMRELAIGQRHAVYQQCPAVGAILALLNPNRYTLEFLALIVWFCFQHSQ
jgi:hypothetical protein